MRLRPGRSKFADRAIDEDKETIGGETTPTRRVGSVWLELKLHSRRGFGTYLVATFVLLNLGADLMYGYLDPRVRTEE